MKKHALLLLLLTENIIAPRSPHRPTENNIPRISIQSLGSKKIYTKQESHFEEYPHFHFDLDRFSEHLWPKEHVAYRANSSDAVDGAHLSNLMEQLLVEVFNKKKVFKDFVILQKKNFNFHHTCGLLVLKCKEFPFVIKLSIENPETYLEPYIKGIEPIAFYFMGGGSNRHWSSLTRIENCKHLKNKLRTLPRWKDCVEFPRKWFWLPNDPRWMKITGENIGAKKYIESKIPGVFAIIADAMDTTHTLDLPTKEKKKIAMDLCNDVDIYMDPHYANFVFQKHPDPSKPFKIVIVDTEHFPTLTGFKHKKHFRNHSSWYQYLIGKYFNDTYLRTKKKRLYAQIEKRELALF